MRRFLRLVRTLCGMLAMLLAGCYVAGRLATDRTHVTQYLYWVPSPAYCAAILGLGVAAWALSLGVPRRDRRACRAWTWRAPLVAALLVALHVVVLDWRAWRFVVPPAPAAPERTLRLMHWNMTYAVPYWWDRYIAAVKKAPRPDVLIVTNPTYKNELDQLAAALGPEYRAVRCGTFVVVSRFPILQTGAASLEIPGADGRVGPDPGDGVNGSTEYLPEWSPIPRYGSSIYDPGHAMFARIDATACLGREIVVWGIDMPSNPLRWRMSSARAAVEHLEEPVPDRAAPGRLHPRFPAPDLIAGDCNIPRGSASLGVLGLGYPTAFEQAGRGYVATWPRKVSVFHLDHVFVGPALRATSYRVYNLGRSEHRAQVAEVTAR